MRIVAFFSKGLNLKDMSAAVELMENFGGVDIHIFKTDGTISAVFQNAEGILPELKEAFQFNGIGHATLRIK